MNLLTTTTTVLRLTAGAAGALHVAADYIDNASGTITPGAPAPLVITGTSVTTIVAAPASGVQRNIKRINVENASGSAAPLVTFERFDGTTAVIEFTCTLLPGEHVTLDDVGVWHHYDTQGAEYLYAGPTPANLGPSGTIAETIPRDLCPEVNTTAAATGTLFLQAIYLRAGQLVSSISIWSATTAAGTPTNGFFALYDAARNLLAQSANFTTEAWAANSVKTKAMTTAYRVPVSGLYYIGLLQVATTIATIKGGTAKTGGQLAAAAPILNGTSSTGLTTTLPNPAAAITAGTASIYAAVS